MNLKAEITVDELLKAMKLCACVPECSWCAYYDPKKLHKDKCYERRNRDFEYYISNLQDTNEALIAGQETLQAHISNQNKEISRLTLLAKLGEKRADDYRAMRDRALKAEAEIEKLKKAGEEAVSCFHRMESLYNIKRMELKVAKAEAIKEFAEKVKESFGFVYDYKIDNLVKEMVGE